MTSWEYLHWKCVFRLFAERVWKQSGEMIALVKRRYAPWSRSLPEACFDEEQQFFSSSAL